MLPANEDGPTPLDLARAAAQAGRIEEAIERYEKILADGLPQAHALIRAVAGLHLRRQGRKAAALEVLRHADRLDGLGSGTLAEIYRRFALEVAPMVAEPHVALARAYARRSPAFAPQARAAYERGYRAYLLLGDGAAAEALKREASFGPEDERADWGRTEASRIAWLVGTDPARRSRRRARPWRGPPATASSSRSSATPR